MKRSLMVIQHYIPNKLRGLVYAIWEQRADTPMCWKILPSGRVELLFRLGPKSRVQAKKLGDHNNPTSNFCFLSGLHTRPLNLSFNRFHFIGIQMSPVAIKALFGIPASEIRDGALESEVLIKNLSRIEDKLKSSCSFQEKATWLENVLLSKICETVDLHVAIKLSKLIQNLSHDKLFVDNLKIEQFLGYSRTHTYRIFNNWFGWSAGYFQRLLKFVHTLNYLHLTSEQLTVVGLEQGYFDQAHFIRSFKEFANMTPGQYRRLKTSIPGQLPF